MRRPRSDRRRWAHGSRAVWERGMERSASDKCTRTILEHEGYYPVVNGYKDPFIDVWATGVVGDDRLRKGSTFADLHALFVFDRKLCRLFLGYVVKAEATLKTVCSRCFTQEYVQVLFIPGREHMQQNCQIVFALVHGIPWKRKKD